MIIHDGLRRMFAEQEDVFYYLTLMNENYPHPAMPEGAEEGILRGMYLLREGEGDGPRVQLLGSGTILREVLAGADLLRDDFGVERRRLERHVSFTELRRDGMEAERWNRLHPREEPRALVRRAVPGGPRRPGGRRRPTTCARSPTRSGRSCAAGRYTRARHRRLRPQRLPRKLRRFFEVDRHHVAVAALRALADEGTVERRAVQQAIEKYGIDPETAPPWTV